MAEYEERFRKFLDEGDWGSETNEDGTLLVASLFPIELFINLTRELVNEDYTNATKEQLEWAIRTLLEERESDLKDYDVFPACDWIVRSSDLDPDARKVTITL